MPEQETMAAARIGWFPAIAVVFITACGLSLVATVYFNLRAGLNLSVLFGGKFLLPNVLGGGLGATAALALLLPLRRAGTELFWAGGVAVMVLLVPMLTRAFDGALAYALGNVQLAQAMLTSNVVQWFYSLLHFPANVVLAIRSAILLALIAWLWPPPGTETPPADA